MQINLLDRSLSMFAVQRQKLQLLGCAVMLLASKYEEIYAPPVDDFVYISDSTYTKEEVLGMERQVLHHLQFRLTVSTQWTFLLRFLKVAVSGEQEKFLARYLLELALLSYGMIKYQPSEIAAAALNLGRQTLRKAEPWVSCSCRRHLLMCSHAVLFVLALTRLCLCFLMHHARSLSSWCR